MAQEIRVRLLDDLDGSEADETVTFALDGKSREIELSHENAFVFRQLLEPYMEASRPARPTSIAAKGSPPGPTQSELREEGARIRAWAREHRVPLNSLGRIPERTRKAWDRHTRRGDRSLLDELLAEAGVDPVLTPPEPSVKFVPVGVGTGSLEERLQRQARSIRRLSDPQAKRLREAVEGDGTATATDAADRTSYDALCRRGCMDRTDENEYTVTAVGRAWVQLNEAAISA
ncbi:Lsr2 family protein [Streptomyces sp. NPDC056500]|uniref:histone-like nucleoid-structuring protein Lsr2 n=1 Tax=Streptomyces sp. NPDC056500 TaxID=3345840 RepID=UPI0036C46D8F